MNLPQRLPISGETPLFATKYNNRLPMPQPPARLSVPKEKKGMGVENVAPNPLDPKKDKKKNAKAKLTPDKLGNMTQEELDEFLASFVGSEEESMMDLMKSATQGNAQDKAMQDLLDKYASSLSTPKFSFRDTQSFRAPGFFQG